MGCKPSKPVNIVAPQSEHSADNSSGTKTVTTELAEPTEKDKRDTCDDTDYGEYSRNKLGLYVRVVDFRQKFPEEPLKRKPEASTANLYCDLDFPHKLTKGKYNDNVEWKRPKEFITAPRFLKGNISRSEITQGSAGTCWFVSVLSSVADNKTYLRELLPIGAYNIEDPQKYDGVFHARFCNFGRWEDVYTDDILPVRHGNMLWGAEYAPDTSVLWVTLLEKAFAKLHGSFDNIYGGQSGDAYLYLTGGIGEMIELTEGEDKAEVLFKRLSNALKSGCVVGTSVPEKYDNCQGLVGPHAFSVVDVVDKPKKMIKLRNPWGRLTRNETGNNRALTSSTLNINQNNKPSKKNQKSSKTPKNMIDKNMNHLPNKNSNTSTVCIPAESAGEFYVTLDNFLRYFEKPTICSQTPDFDCDGKPDPLYYVTNIYGEWTEGACGGCYNNLQNPRFSFVVTGHDNKEKDDIPLFIHMVQHSKHDGVKPVSMKCYIFRSLAEEKHNTGSLLVLESKEDKSAYTSGLQATFRRNVRAGRYVVIPSQYAGGETKSFLMRVFTEKPLKNCRMISSGTTILQCEAVDVIEGSGQSYKLECETVLLHQFVKGFNSGGQISQRASHHKNPQYVVTMTTASTDLVPLVIQVLQPSVEKMEALGIIAFQLESFIQPPVLYDYLHHHNDSSVQTTEGKHYVFMRYREAKAKYLLPPGRYLVLLHLDKPNVNLNYAVVFRSNIKLSIDCFQTRQSDSQN